MKKGLNAITDSTRELWYKVNEKYGEYKYTLAVNGLDEVVLCKGYTEEISKGTKQVKTKLRELLQEVK